MKKTKNVQLNFSLCVKVELFLVALIILFTMLSQDSLVSLCFILSFIVLLLYTGLRLNTRKFNLSVLVLLMFSVINVLWNASISRDANMSFDYMKKVFMFAAFILILYYSQEDRVSEGTYKYALILPALAGTALVMSYFVFNNKIQYGGGITLGFSNPNFTGMWLLHLMIYMFLLMVSSKRKIWLRIFCVIMIGLMVWLILQTKARSCLVGLIVFFGLCLLGRKKKKKRVLNPVFLFVVIIFPIVLVFIYQFLLNSSWFLRMFAFMASEGKGLDARLRVWSPAIKLFKESIWLGDYCGISDGTGVSQLHNTHLDVVCSYGILPFLLFLQMLFREGKKMMHSCKSFFNYYAICGCFAIIATGAFEAAVVAGAMGLNLLTAGIVLLANRPVNGGLNDENHIYF